MYDQYPNQHGVYGRTIDQAAFDEAGLEIPYPHSTMTITQGSIKEGSIKAGLPSAQPGNDSERQESNP